MAAQVPDPLGIVRAIAADPDALSELRRLTMSNELSRLGDEVHALSEAQARTEEHVDALTAALTRLTEAQERTEQRLEALAQAQERTEQRLEALIAAQAHTEQRLEALTAAQARTEQGLDTLAQAQERTEQALQALVNVVAELAADLRALAIRSDHDHGVIVELKYERHAGAYFASIARRVRPLGSDRLDDILESAVASGAMTESEADDVRRADLLFRGRRRGDDTEVVLVVEASGTLGDDDVTRAADRAALLARAGVASVPVIAGERIAERTLVLARRRGVWAVLNGRAEPPDAA